MKKTVLVRTTLLGLALTSVVGVAAADDQDVTPISGAPDGLVAVSRGLQGPKGLLSVRVAVAMNLSSDLVGKPISIAPDIYYSLSDKLQIGLIHTGPMHWQTKPGAGLCVTGKDNGCPNVYDNVGFDAMYGLIYSDKLHLSAHATFYVLSIDQSFTAVGLGLAGKYHFNDKVSLFFDPQVLPVLSDRDLLDDGLFVPLEVQLQAAEPTTVKLLTGINGSLQAFGDTYEVPVGIGIVQNISESLDVGVRFSFDNLLGKVPDGVGRADQRSLAALVTLRK